MHTLYNRIHGIYEGVKAAHESAHTQDLSPLEEQLAHDGSIGGRIAGFIATHTLYRIAGKNVPSLDDTVTTYQNE
jgi:hypothetical protein